MNARGEYVLSTRYRKNQRQRRRRRVQGRVGQPAVSPPYLSPPLCPALSFPPAKSPLLLCYFHLCASSCLSRINEERNSAKQINKAKLAVPMPPRDLCSPKRSLTHQPRGKKESRLRLAQHIARAWGGWEYGVYRALLLHRRSMPGGGTSLPREQNSHHMPTPHHSTPPYPPHTFLIRFLLSPLTKSVWSKTT